VNTGTAHMSFSRDVAIEHGAMSSRLKSIEYMYNKLNQESLIQGIEAFISRNRCSLSNEDLVLLNDCLDFIKSCKKTQMPSLETMGKIVELLLKFLSASDDIMNLFH
jgi:hypothetical protein